MMYVWDFIRLGWAFVAGYGLAVFRYEWLVKKLP